MNQEHKDLLLKDLCGRLPYGVKVFYEYVDNLNKKTYGYSLTLNTWCIDEMKAEKAVVKPYLFPLSSMTEEQLYNNPIGFSQMLTIKADRDWENITINRRSYYKLVDWFNKNHFDYRGLIEKGIAIDCTNLNIY